jgi:hypothetical protein
MHRSLVSCLALLPLAAVLVSASAAVAQAANPWDSADDAARQNDVDQAKKWANMAMSARKANEERAVGSNPQP